MVTIFRRKLMRSLFWVTTAWFAIQGCSSSEEQEEDLLVEDQQEEAAEVDYDAAAPVGSSGVGVAGETMADVSTTDDGLDDSGLGDGSLADGLPPLGGLPSDVEMGLEDEAEDAAEELAAQDAGMMPGAASPLAEEFFNYTIVKGDWLSKLAGRVYGDIYKWPVIASANPQISNPDLIYPGDVIKVPITGPSSKTFAETYNGSASLGPKNGESTAKLTKVVVKAGDTLGTIAARVLGSADAWQQVWEQNKTSILNPHQIEVGQVVTLDLADVTKLGS